MRNDNDVNNKISYKLLKQEAIITSSQNPININI